MRPLCNYFPWTKCRLRAFGAYCSGKVQHWSENQTQHSTILWNSALGHWAEDLCYLNHQTKSLYSMGHSHALKCDSTVVEACCVGYCKECQFEMDTYHSISSFAFNEVIGSKSSKLYELTLPVCRVLLLPYRKISPNDQISLQKGSLLLHATCERNIDFY